MNKICNLDYKIRGRNLKNQIVERLKMHFLAVVLTFGRIELAGVEGISCDNCEGKAMVFSLMDFL